LLLIESDIFFIALSDKSRLNIVDIIVQMVGKRDINCLNSFVVKKLFITSISFLKSTIYGKKKGPRLDDLII